MSADAAKVLAIVERAFPHVDRPAEADILFHRDGCAHCEMTIRELRRHADAQVPLSAIRSLFDELGTLSAQGMAWLLPVYLRYVLTDEDERDPLATEFLIYALGPSPEHEDETRSRLSLLNVHQVEALIAVVEHWKTDARWSEYCGEELTRATGFLRSIGDGHRTSG